MLYEDHTTPVHSGLQGKTKLCVWSFDLAEDFISNLHSGNIQGEDE